MIALLSLLFAPAWAQQANPCHVVVNATVYTADGPKEGWSVVIDEGRVADLGPELVAARGCRRIDGTDKVVTPGLIDVSTQVGLVEVSMEAASRSENPGGDDPIRASFSVLDGYNPRSTLVPITRAAGITTVLSHPGGGWISGTSAVMDLSGATQAEQLVREDAAMHVSLAGTGKLAAFRELLDDVATYRDQQRSFDKGELRQLGASRLDLEALIPVLEGEMPVMTRVEQASDIEALLRFVDETGVRVVLVGGAEAWLHAAELAAREIPVVVDALRYGPGGYDMVHARPDNAALLAAAGVEVVLATFSSHNAPKLTQMAGNAVREGMEHTAAVQAITAAPARALGLEGYGVLEKGAVGNVVVFSGDPLEIGTRVEHVFIRGKAISLQTRFTELHERYQELPGSPLPPLPLPRQAE